MRRVLLPALLALALAIGLVLVLAGGEEDVVVEPGQEQSTDHRPQTTDSGPQDQSSPPADETEGVEQAAILYIEAAQSGEIDAPVGLPTTDELSIEDVRVEGDRATVRLVGGARLFLRRSGGGWQVERARPARVRPTPPSNG
jgi:hypothetical protein